jgi:hypothetical protein
MSRTAGIQHFLPHALIEAFYKGIPILLAGLDVA